MSVQDDAHLCLRCNNTIIGLQNYVEHCQSPCHQMPPPYTISPKMSYTYEDNRTHEACEIINLHSMPYNPSRCEIITCQYGCGHQFLKCKQQEHEELCSHMIVACINKEDGCDAVIQRGLWWKHIPNCSSMNTAPLKELSTIIRCPYGCGHQYVKYEEEQHKENCSHMMIDCFNKEKNWGCNARFQRYLWYEHIPTCSFMPTVQLKKELDAKVLQKSPISRWKFSEASPRLQPASSRGTPVPCYLPLVCMTSIDVLRPPAPPPGIVVEPPPPPPPNCDKKGRHSSSSKHHSKCVLQ